MDDFFRSVERFVNDQIKPNINDWDEAGEFPRELYKQAGDLGLLGLGYPEEVGGFECTLADRLKLSNLVCSAGSGGLLAGLFSHNIGLPPLLNHGNEELVQMIAPAVLKGDAISALAITEPSGGSDVANLKTKADLFQKDGVPHYRINGEKVFITSGVRADWLTVAVRTGEPGARGISVLMVPGNAKGLTRSLLKKTGWGLTGRADLWMKADELIAKRPWVGLGYNAFWIPGNLDAEALWRLLGIASRSGFNFHNTPREVLVHLGIVGLILFTLVALVGLIRLFIGAMANPNAGLIYQCGLTIYFLLKLPFEVIGFGTMHFSTIFVYAFLGAGYRAGANRDHVSKA